MRVEIVDAEACYDCRLSEKKAWSRSKRLKRSYHYDRGDPILMETSFEVVKEEDFRGRSLGRGETLPDHSGVASARPSSIHTFTGNMRVNIGNSKTA